MARIMGIDYGTKRIGLAVTDPLQIIATGLDTVAAADIFGYLEKYLAVEEVELFVVGDPLNLDGTPAQSAPMANEFVAALNKKYPNIKTVRQDERFSSVEAKQAILKSGAKKKKRRDKALVDKISAVIILQDYLQHGLL